MNRYRYNGVTGHRGNPAAASENTLKIQTLSFEMTL